MKSVFLNTGPLGMLANANASAETLAARAWAKELLVAGAEIVIPEIADYEVRRDTNFARMAAVSPCAVAERLGYPLGALSRDFSPRRGDEGERFTRGWYQAILRRSRLFSSLLAHGVRARA